MIKKMKINTSDYPLIPSRLWNKLKKTSFAYIVAGSLRSGVTVDDLIKRFRSSGPGSQIPGRTQDSSVVVSILYELKRNCPIVA